MSTRPTELVASTVASGSKLQLPLRVVDEVVVVAPAEQHEGLTRRPHARSDGQAQASSIFDEAGWAGWTRVGGSGDSRCGSSRPPRARRRGGAPCRPVPERRGHDLGAEPAAPQSTLAARRTSRRQASHPQPAPPARARSRSTRACAVVTVGGSSSGWQHGRCVRAEAPDRCPDGVLIAVGLRSLRASFGVRSCRVA